MEMTQNAKEWYEWRLEGIGASDAPVVMEKSKYKTKAELWREKVEKKPVKDEDMETNYIQEKGHRLEAWARPGFEFSTGLTWPPALFEHKSFPFIRASLDGWNAQICEAWECKYMGKDLWEVLANEELSLSERIPPHYFDQIMQQFFVSGAKKIHLTGIKEEKIDEVKQLKQYTLEIPRLPEFEDYINKTLAPQLFKFWKCVQDKTEPESNYDSASEIVDVVDEGLKELVLNYAKLYEQEKELKGKAKKESDKILGEIPEKVKDIKEQIHNHDARIHDKMEIEGIKLTLARGKEIVNYEDALNSFFTWIRNMKQHLIENGQTAHDQVVNAVKNFPDEPSLEKYTKAGSPSLKITLPKKKKAQSEKPEQKEPEKKEPKKKGPSVGLLSAAQEASAEFEETRDMTKQQVEVYGRMMAFKNPKTNRKPQRWREKPTDKKIKYLRSAARMMDNTIWTQQMLKLAEDIERNLL